MLRSIDGYQPRRRRARWGRNIAWLLFAASLVASGWVIADMIRRGLLVTILG